MKVKICGIRCVKSARASVEAGADFIGLVFVEQARRRISVKQAREITEIVSQYRNPPKLVGLFMNQPDNWVKRVYDATGIDYVQLCGNESNEYIQRLALPTIVRVAVSSADNAQTLYPIVESHIELGRLIVIESATPSGLGGTGQAWDWSRVRPVTYLKGVLLAGGLTLDKLHIAIGTDSNIHKPWGVDVSSGVETDGEKDAKKIHNFVKKVKSI